MGQTETELRAPTFDEQVAIDNYQGASKEALTAANSVGDKIVTAAFSFATAYGAVIALVSPEEKPEAVVAVIPFVLLALAAVIALYSQSRGVKLEGSTEVSQLRSVVNTAITTKRRLSWAALVLLALGVAVAGAIVYDQYGQPEKEKPVAVQVWLTPAGVDFANQACGGGVTAKVDGTVASAGDLENERVGINVAKASCAAGPSTLYLDKDLIAGVRGPAAPA
jgi:hypothetical protein